MNTFIPKADCIYYCCPTDSESKKIRAQIRAFLAGFTAFYDKALDTKTPDDKALDDKALDDKALDDKASDAKTPDDKALDDKSPDDKSPDDKSPDDKASDAKTPDDKASDAKTREALIEYFKARSVYLDEKDVERLMQKDIRCAYDPSLMYVSVAILIGLKHNAIEIYEVPKILEPYIEYNVTEMDSDYIEVNCNRYKVDTLKANPNLTTDELLKVLYEFSEEEKNGFMI